ncbi:MAG TPA: hypothetical protein VMV32_06330 [Ignavibacteriaceae bacterium]|nr:hypothetical protein [Ignavibacteriaceae bacterium]
MKSIYYLIVVFFSLVISGCSSTYTIKDFSSKEKFYEDFNNSVKYKNINVTLSNDSSFSVPYGAILSDDSLLTITNIKHTVILRRSSVKEIKEYYDTDFTYPLHEVILTNGKKLKGDDVRILPDSSIEYTVRENVFGEKIPLKKVKEVNYKNHWLGIPSGFLIGAVSGFGVSYILDQFVNRNDVYNRSHKNIFIYIAGIPLGALTGTIWGWINGYSNTYKFNP